jgi:ankyrin repeat protein
MDGKKLFRNIVINGCLLVGFAFAQKAPLSKLEDESHIDETDIENWIDLTDNEGNTPLGNIVDQGEYEIAKLLLKYGADPNKKSDSFTPLVHAIHFCCRQDSKVGFAMVELLLENGANPNPDWNQTEMLPLHAAILQKASQKLINILIHSGADIKGRERNGNMPLHWAAWNLDGRQIQILIDKGAPINALNNLQQTPLDGAILRDKVERTENPEELRENFLMKDEVAHKYNSIVKLLRHHGALTGEELMGSHSATARDDGESENDEEMAIEVDKV